MYHLPVFSGSTQQIFFVMMSIQVYLGFFVNCVYLISSFFVLYFVLLLIKPPLATARAASCNGPVRLFVCVRLSVFLSPKYTLNAIFSKTKQFRAMVSIVSRTWVFPTTHY